jgi:transcription elongation factor Elf1
MKLCRRCGEHKSIDCFGITRRRTLAAFVPRRQPYCKSCRVRLQTERDRRGGDAAVKLKQLRRRMKLRRNYGITPEEHAAQLERQQYNCAICSRSLVGLSPQTIHVDHCHVTGNLRGILCGPCNTGIGNFRESETAMLAAIAYLRTGGSWSQSVRAVPGSSANIKAIAA